MLQASNPLTVKLKEAPDFEKLMREEEEQVKKMVMDIVKWKPDIVITEKGLSGILVL